MTVLRKFPPGLGFFQNREEGGSFGGLMDFKGLRRASGEAGASVVAGHVFEGETGCGAACGARCVDVVSDHHRRDAEVAGFEDVAAELVPRVACGTRSA